MAVVGRAFREDDHLTSPPPTGQKVTFVVLVPTGRLLGYRADHPEYSPLDPLPE